MKNINSYNLRETERDEQHNRGEAWIDGKPRTVDVEQ